MKRRKQASKEAHKKIKSKNKKEKLESTKMKILWKERRKKGKVKGG